MTQEQFAVFDISRCKHGLNDEGRMNDEARMDRLVHGDFDISHLNIPSSLGIDIGYRTGCV